jgi:phosphotriesterase-related protein
MSHAISRREALALLGVGAASAAVTFPKGAIIRTVLKDCAPEELASGATLFHEHMSFAPDFMTRWTRFAFETRAANAARSGQAPPKAAPAAAAPTGQFFMEDAAIMADEMTAARNEGVSCIVDGGHPDMGRNIDFLRQISRRSGLPIVASAGFYAQPFYPKEIAAWSEQQITDALLAQVASDAPGAFGEIGSWDEITADERKVFRAVGKAHVRTKLPIFTHTGIPGKSALEQLDILESAGVDPRHVVIGHLGNLVDPDLKVQKAICKRGAFVGFDRQGGAGDAQQVPMVMALLEAGYAGNMMFSSDLSGVAQTKHGGGPGYAKTLTVFLPKLKAAGATDEVLRGITIDNPRRFLAFVPERAR